MALTRQQQLEAIKQQLLGAQEQFGAMQQRISTEGITGPGGEMLMAPTAPPTEQTGGVGGGLGGEGGTDWQKYILSSMEELKDLYKQQQAAPPPSEVYGQYREQLGIPGMETTQAGLTGQVADVEGLLDNLEEDISARATRVGGVMTEAQRRRRLAAEAKPLREQLADLYKSQATGQTGLTSARQELATMMQLEEMNRAQQAGYAENILGLMPYYQEAYAEPEVAEAPRAPTMKAWGGRQYQWDPSTQSWTDVGVAKAPEVAEPAEPYGKYTTRLKEEISSLFAGRYGREGSREKVIEILKREFPTKDVSGDIYSKIPNGYEAQIKGEEEVEQYITADYIKQNLGNRLNVKKVLKASGQAGIWKLQATEYNNLVDNLIKLAENYRRADYDDREIWEVILKKIEGWEK